MNKREWWKSLAKTIGGAILGFLALLGYVGSWRPWCEANWGLYQLGLIDGGLIVAILFALVFYLASLISHEEKDKKKGFFFKA